MSDVPAKKQIAQTEFQIALLKKLEGSKRFRSVNSSESADDELHGLIFSQQMMSGWGAKVVLGARYELRDAVTHKLLWRSTIVTECPYPDWGGFLLGPEPKPDVAARCAMDKNLDKMVAALDNLNF